MKWLLLTFGLLLSPLHDFHVSITHAQLDAETGQLEITMKLFVDDLEGALFRKDSPELYLGQANELPNANEMIFDYVQRHFELTCNGDPLPIQFREKTISHGICFIKMYVTDPNVEDGLTVRNTVFFDRFEDQSNVVHLDINGLKMSLTFDKRHPVREVKID